MAKTFYPFDAGAGANVLEDQWRKMAKFWCPTGIIDGELNGLTPFGDSTGMQLKVMSGRAWIQGHYFESDAQETIPIGAAHATLVRWDILVLRADFTANTIDFAILPGTPVAVGSIITHTDWTQSSAIWEIPIAMIYVAAAISTITAASVIDWRQLVTVPQQSIQCTYEKNFLINGNMDVWQRGNGPFTASGTQTADRWLLSLGASCTASVSRTTGGVPLGSATMMGVVHTRSSGTAYSTITQNIESTDRLNLTGRQLTIAFRVYCSVAGLVSAHLNNGASSTQSEPNKLVNTWETIYATINCPSQATMTGLTAHLLVFGSGTFYIDWATLVIGGLPGIMVPPPIGVDTMLCLRYYESFGYYIELQAYASAGAMPRIPFFYATKGGSPTVTKVGTWALSNCTGQPTVSLGGSNHCLFQTQATVTGMVVAATDSADDAITIEWNP